MTLGQKAFGRWTFGRQAPSWPFWDIVFDQMSVGRNIFDQKKWDRNHIFNCVKIKKKLVKINFAIL